MPPSPPGPGEALEPLRLDPGPGQKNKDANPGRPSLSQRYFVVGKYPPESRFKEYSLLGRLGNIEGRPNNADLQEVAARVTGILRV